MRRKKQVKTLKPILDKINNFESHIVPIIADIDAGFGNEEATLLAHQTNDPSRCLKLSSWKPSIRC